MRHWLRNIFQRIDLSKTKTLNRKFLLGSAILMGTWLNTCLFAELTDHFKPACDKQDHHRMRNIDFIYMINLDHRTEKFQQSQDQLATYGIYPYRFSAVNGWELGFETLNDVGVLYEADMRPKLWGTCYFPENEGLPHHEICHVVGRNYFCHCMSRGAIGIVLSHLSILQDAYDSGYETIWVMEDDIDVVRDPRILSELIDRLDQGLGRNNWDILFTDRDTKNRNGQYIPVGKASPRLNYVPKDERRRFRINTQISPDFRRVGARAGAYSMILRRSGMKKLLDFFITYKIFFPYDMDYYMPNDLRMITVLDDVVSTKITALSDNGINSLNASPGDSEL